jgi:hypothetical protein
MKVTYWYQMQQQILELGYRPLLYQQAIMWIKIKKNEV